MWRDVGKSVEGSIGVEVGGVVLDFERLRLIVNSLIPEVSISQECSERSSRIASSSELDKERTKELSYDATVYILERKAV